MNCGFVKVAAAVPEIRVADCTYNAQVIEQSIKEAYDKGVHIVCFPELVLSGCTCGDLFYNEHFLAQVEDALLKIVENTAKMDIVSIIGLPFCKSRHIFNCAVVVHKGRILSIAAKRDLTLDEKRWFTSSDDANFIETEIAGLEASFKNDMIVSCPGFKFSVGFSSYLYSNGCNRQEDISFLLASDVRNASSCGVVENMLTAYSRREIIGSVYVSAGNSESTTDAVYTGAAYIVENGELLAKDESVNLGSKLLISDIDIDIVWAERRNSKLRSLYPVEELFEESCSLDVDKRRFKLDRKISSTPFLPKKECNSYYCHIIETQAYALLKRMKHTKLEKMVVGISGGLDSTLALLVCVKVCDLLGLPHSNIIAITMPGFGTSGRTYNNAVEMIKSYGCTFKEISIKEACLQHFADISHDVNKRDAAYENAQARERTQILMDVANSCAGIVVGTGDLSELALGWATYNGDHMSMYAVNAGIPKTLVRSLVTYCADIENNLKMSGILRDIVDTPVSPELLPTDSDGRISQKTEDLVGPYELHDFFIYYTVKYGLLSKKIIYLSKKAFEGVYEEEMIIFWYNVFVKRFFSQQFKRNCMPDGPIVCGLSLSPRGTWQMPSDAVGDLWLI